MKLIKYKRGQEAATGMPTGLVIVLIILLVLIIVIAALYLGAGGWIEENFLR